MDASPAPLDAPVRWRVELWPNRSLSRKGVKVFLGIMAACFAFFLTLTYLAPGSRVDADALDRGFLVILPFIGLVMGLMALAFALSNREGRYVERLSIVGDRLVVEAEHPARRPRRWEFSPYWTRVSTRDTREVENQLVLTESDRAVAIGAFLTPGERKALAGEIRRALSRFRAA